MAVPGILSFLLLPSMYYGSWQAWISPLHFMDPVDDSILEQIPDP